MMLFKVAAAAMSIDEVVSGTVADATALHQLLSTPPLVMCRGFGMTRYLSVSTY